MAFRELIIMKLFMCSFDFLGQYQQSNLWREGSVTVEAYAWQLGEEATPSRSSLPLGGLKAADLLVAVATIVAYRAIAP